MSVDLSVYVCWRRCHFRSTLSMVGEVPLCQWARRVKLSRQRAGKTHAARPTYPTYLFANNDLPVRVIVPAMYYSADA